MGKKGGQDRVLEFIKLIKSGVSREDISEKMDIPTEDVDKLVDRARSRGYLVFNKEGQLFLNQMIEFGRTTSLPPLNKRSIDFMVICDFGLGLRTQQGTLMRTCYKIAKKEGVHFVVLLGNIIAGKPGRGQEREFFYSTFEEQVKYAGRVIPQIPGLKQYLVNGWREISWLREGKNFGLALSKIRPDIRYVGDLRETFELKNGVIIPMIALKSDVTTYTLSYALRGLSENLMEAVRYAESSRKNPKLVIIGGLGAPVFQPAKLPFKLKRSNNFHAVAVPSLHAITPSQLARKKRGGLPVLGCLIVRVDYNKKDRFQDVRLRIVDLTAHQRFNDYLEEVPILPRLRKCEKTILEMLSQKPRTVGELSRAIGKSSGHTKRIVNGLKSLKKKKGETGETNVYQIQWIPEEGRYQLVRMVRQKFPSINLKDLFAKKVKFGYISDSHFGEIHERPELYRESLFEMNRLNVDAANFCGDATDGEGAYPGHIRELKIVGADSQRAHLLKYTPSGLKFPIYWISGSSRHEGVYRHVGHDIIKVFAELYNLKQRREVIKYLGGSSGITSPVKGVRHYLVHPKGGATIGLSYRAQLAIEHYLEQLEIMRVNIFAFGHFHVALLFVYKGIPVVLVPCLVDQTTYLKEHNLVPWLGMWIIEYWTDYLGNITSIEPHYTAYMPKIPIS